MKKAIRWLIETYSVVPGITPAKAGLIIAIAAMVIWMDLSSAQSIEFGRPQIVDTPEPMRTYAECLESAMIGWLGEDELMIEHCMDNYELPGALDIECAGYEEFGYPDESDRVICNQHIKKNILPYIGWKLA